jgi:hypothetical protein
MILQLDVKVENRFEKDYKGLYDKILSQVRCISQFNDAHTATMYLNRKLKGPTPLSAIIITDDTLARVVYAAKHGINEHEVHKVYMPHWNPYFGFCLINCTEANRAEECACHPPDRKLPRMYWLENPYHHYRTITQHLVSYARDGGTVIFSCRWGDKWHGDHFTDYIQNFWGLPWIGTDPKSERYELKRRQYQLNPITHEMLRKQASKKYETCEMTSILIKGVRSRDIVYGGPNKSAAVAFTQYGNGWVGFVGDLDKAWVLRKDQWTGAMVDPTRAPVDRRVPDNRIYEPRYADNKSIKQVPDMKKEIVELMSAMCGL